MKCIPKGCDVSNCKEKSNGPKFVRGLNLATWNCLCRKNKEKKKNWVIWSSCWRKGQSLKLNQYYAKDLNSEEKLLDKKHMAHWRINIRIRLSFICSQFLFQSSFLWLNNFFFNVICFKLLLLMVKIQNQVFNCCRKTTDCFESDSTMKKLF